MKIYIQVDFTWVSTHIHTRVKLHSDLCILEFEIANSGNFGGSFLFFFFFFLGGGGWEGWWCDGDIF